MRKTLYSTLLVLPLMLTGCSFFDHSQDEPQNDASTAAYDQDKDNPINPENSSLSAPQEKLGDYSVNDLQGATRTAQSYITASLTTPELLSGKWWDDGHNMGTLARLGTFSGELQKTIKQLNPEKELGAQSTQSIALFLAPSKDVKASQECATELKNCSNQPFYNTAKWKEVNKKAVQVTVSASVNRNLVKDGNPVTSVDTYHYKIALTREKNTWTIQQIQNSYTIGQKAEGDQK